MASHTTRSHQEKPLGDSLKTWQWLRALQLRKGDSVAEVVEKVWFSLFQQPLSDERSRRIGVRSVSHLKVHYEWVSRSGRATNEAIAKHLKDFLNSLGDSVAFLRTVIIGTSLSYNASRVYSKDRFLPF